MKRASDRINSITRSNQNLGFTLLEVMIVLAILGAISVLGYRKLNKKEDLKSAIRRFATATREIRNLAKINGKSYRLAIDLSGKKGQSYWVESSPKTGFIDPKKETKKHEIVNEQSKDPDLDSDGYTPDQRVMKDPKTLPSGWFFTEIETMGADGPKSEGLVYIHFLNTGVAEEATVQISDKGKTTWTIHVQALIGRPEIYTEKKTLRELTE